MEGYKSANDYTIKVSIDIILIPLVSAPWQYNKKVYNLIN